LRRPIKFLIPGLLWFLFSFILLTLPGSVFPKENWLDKIWADKWIHIILFATLIILWAWAYYKLKTEKRNLKKIFLWLTVTGIMYGVAMEFVQKYFIPNRSFDIGDMASDAVGCFLGFFYSIRRFIKNKPL
jgi:VanZ family protein